MSTQFPYELIDLTHTLSENTPSWDGGCGFKHEIALDYHQCDPETRFRVQHVGLHAGIGTHIDAPSHCIPGARTVEQLKLDNLLAPLIVIDVAHKATESYQISTQDIISFEHQYGPISEQSFVAFNTGWGRHWENPVKYRNNYFFPSIAPSVANFLISRNIKGIGIDTLSPDIPSSGFPVHQIILGADKYIVENIAHLDKLPPVGSYILILPLKGKGLTESPVRVVALLPFS